MKQYVRYGLILLVHGAIALWVLRQGNPAAAVALVYAGLLTCVCESYLQICHGYQGIVARYKELLKEAHACIDDLREGSA